MDIKENLKSSFLYPIFDKIRDKYLFQRRRLYFSRLRDFIKPSTSIISSNCFAGRIMQDLGTKYNSPTLGLYFFAPDYLEFVSNLEYYLTEAKLEFKDKSKYELGNERRKKWPHWYPIGSLDDVEIEFLHYHSEEEAAEKWYRRASRINWEDLLIIGMEQNLCRIEDIEKFSSLPYRRKLFFTTRKYNYNSVVSIKEFDGHKEVGDPYKKGHIFYKYLVEHLSI
jgi:uncharacterized protein (DUF1919 family)